MDHSLSFFKNVVVGSRFQHIAFALNGGKNSVVTFDLVKKCNVPVKNMKIN